MFHTVIKAESVPIVIEPKPGESPLSFLSRVAYANRYENVTWLFQNQPRLRWDSGRWPNDTVAALATICGLDFATFENLCYRPHPEAGRLGDQRHILGSRAPGQVIGFAVQKYCPHCLTEHGFNAAFFDLEAVDVCPRHALRLHTKCPSCEAPTTWGRPGVTHCGACDADLRTAPAGAVPIEELQGTAVIAERFGFPIASGTKLAPWPDGAKAFDLGESIELLAVLARLATDHRDQSPFMAFPPGTAYQRIQIGYDQLADWPAGYFRCLDAIAEAAPDDHRAQASRQKLFGFARILGEFYNRLAGAEHEPFLLLKEAFGQYSAQQTKIPIVGRHDGALYKAEDVANRKLITPAEAERILGRKYYSLKKLMDAGTLKPAVEVGGKRQRVFLDRNEVEAISAGGAPLVKKKAAEKLGLPLTKLNQLVGNGIVVPLTSPMDKGKAHYLFAVVELEAFIARIRALVRPDPDFKPNIPLKTLLRGQETLRVSQAGLFEGIYAGDLPVRGWDDAQAGLAGALFNNREVERFLHLRHDIERGDADGLTGLRVSHILRTAPSSIPWLCEKGVLRLSKSATAKRPKIDRGSVEAMQRGLITANEIASRYRTNGEIIAKALDHVGVRPLHDVDSEYGLLLYPRAAVEGLDLSDAIHAVGRKAGRSKEQYRREWRADRRARGLPSI